jgi:hypothetical protein
VAVGKQFLIHQQCLICFILAGDVLLTGNTAIFFIKYKKEVLSQTVGVLDALTRLTFQTAAPETPGK